MNMWARKSFPVYPGLVKKVFRWLLYLADAERCIWKGQKAIQYILPYSRSLQDCFSDNLRVKKKLKKKSQAFYNSKQSLKENSPSTNPAFNLHPIWLKTRKRKKRKENKSSCSDQVNGSIERSFLPALCPHTRKGAKYRVGEKASLRLQS